MKTYKVIFMAFAVMVLGAFVITSCSNNEEEHTTPNQNNRREMNELIEELRQEWQSSISSSEEYLNFLDSVEAFGSKLPPEATPYLEDRDMILSWIDVNISLTGFNNFSEAESELNAVETRYLDIMVANEVFFQNVSLVDNPYRDTDIFLPFPFQLEIPVANGAPCHNLCINDAVACSDYVDSVYRDRMGAAQMLMRMGLLPAAAALTAAATIAQHAGQKACSEALDACMDKC